MRDELDVDGIGAGERDCLIADARLEFATNDGVLSVSTVAALSEAGYLVQGLLDEWEAEGLAE